MQYDDADMNKNCFENSFLVVSSGKKTEMVQICFQNS